MTRNPDGAPARLLQAAGAEVVHADFLDRPSLTRALAGAYGAFSVQNMLPLGTAVETMQGYAFADAAKAAGVRHLVYSSIGGAERATGIEHFESKWAIEEHIRRIEVPATILRPVFFLDNLATPGPWGTVVWGAVAWALRGGKKLQVIALDDLGAFVALVLADPQRFIGQAIELAGDEVTFDQIRTAQLQATGQRRVALPLLAPVLRLLDRDLSQMFRWLRTSGYAADLTALRQLLPSLQRLPEGLRQAGKAATLPGPPR